MTQSSEDATNRWIEIENLLETFFQKYPDDAYRDVARGFLSKLVANSPKLTGQPGGWAGGLVHAISAWTPLQRCHVIRNSELEELFGTSMGTIRTRAERIWQIVEAESGRELLASERFRDFNLRDEANAICAYAFRNGPIEDIHASVDSDGRNRISDPEMKQLMIEASRKVAELLEMKERTPEQYQVFIRGYNRTWCAKWER